MAAQETYQIKETTSTVLRESGPHYGGHKDLAVIKSQHDRLLDLLYKDAERGYRYDTVTIKRYVVYLAPAEALYPEDSGKRIGEFSRLDMAEMVCDALNAKQQAEINKTAKIDPINMSKVQEMFPGSKPGAYFQI
jgi:hypothetical protein